MNYNYIEKLVCPNCGYVVKYLFYNTIHEYPYIYVCDECRYQVVINSREKEIEKLIRYSLNEIKLTMWD